MCKVVHGFQVCHICHHPVGLLEEGIRLPVFSEISNKLCSKCSTRLKDSVALIGKKDDQPFGGYKFIKPETYNKYFNENIEAKTIVYIEFEQLKQLF